MKYAFDTTRLRVFSGTVDISEFADLGENILFVGFPNSWDEAPMPLVTVLIQTFHKSADGGDETWSIVQWIETADTHRRRGVAREVLDGLRGHLPHKLHLTSGVTTAGAAFVEAIERRPST